MSPKIKLGGKAVPVSTIRKIMSNPLRSKAGEFQPASGRKIYPSRSMPARILPPQIPPESVAASSVSRPAQSPPEIASAIAPGVTNASVALPLSDEEMINAMRGEVTHDASNLSAWQEVVPRRLARSNRISSQASPAMSGKKSPRILHLSDVNSPVPYPVLTSSTSGVSSETSDSSDPTYVEPTLPLPQLSTTEQLSLTEPASIAERILSSEGRMSSA